MKKPDFSDPGFWIGCGLTAIGFGFWGYRIWGSTGGACPTIEISEFAPIL